MSKGLVYILVNPSMPDFVKIGYTDDLDIKKRLRELNNPTSVPLSFRAYATLEVENPKQIETYVHGLFDIIDSKLHSIEILENGKKRTREFFRVTPEQAFEVLKIVASLNGTLSGLKKIKPTEKEQKEEDEVQTTPKRSKMTFKELNIPVGSELIFVYDDSEKCTVADEIRSVLYDGEKTSLSTLAQKLTGYKYKPQGPSFWKYGDETLLERRLRMEKE